MLLKESSPVIGPSLIDMIVATLPRYRRGEKKKVAQGTKLADKRAGSACRQVFANLKAHSEVEMLAADYLGETVHLKITLMEKRRLDHETAWINVITIEADCLPDPKFQGSAQPGSDATTNIDH